MQPPPGLAERSGLVYDGAAAVPWPRLPRYGRAARRGRDRLRSRRLARHRARLQAPTARSRVIGTVGYQVTQLAVSGRYLYVLAGQNSMAERL